MFLDKRSIEKTSIKKKRKPLKDYFDYRNNLINQVGLILFSAFVISSTLFWVFQNRFTEENWKNNNSKRYKMVDEIIDSKIFIGKTQAEVIDVLGIPNEQNYDNKIYLSYYISEAPSFVANEPTQLIFHFKNNRVVKVVEENR